MNCSAPQERSRLERNIRLISWVQLLLATIGISIPALTFLWRSCGLSLGEILVLQAIFSCAVAALEVPSGYLADIYGRKLALVVATFGAALGAVCYSVTSSFNGFLVAEILWAFTFAFASGADHALFLATLDALGKEKDSQRLWGALRARSLVVCAASMVLGGALASYDLRLPLYLEIAPMVLAFIVALLVVEPERTPSLQAHSQAGVRDLLNLAYEALRKDARLRWLMLFPAFILSMTRFGVWLYQPYFALAGMQVAEFGMVFALFELTAAAASKWAYSVEKRVAERQYAMLAIAAVALSYSVTSCEAVIALGSLFLVHQLVRGCTHVIFSDYVGKYVGDARRATFLSLQSMLGSLVYSLLLLPVSWLSDDLGVLLTLQMISVAGVTFGIAMLSLYSKHAHTP